QRFGKVMRLFAPLYLSNECINNCKYCGFSRDNPILRVTLTVEDVRREARALLAQGFRNLLLVSGEHPKFVSNGYLVNCVRALYGLSDWRLEALSLAAHADYLLRNCWKAQLTISLPRLRPCAGEFEPPTRIGDRELVQLVCAFRLMFPDAGLVLSTREPAKLRDGLIPLGITLMSAGSHTEPGGYTS